MASTTKSPANVSSVFESGDPSRTPVTRGSVWGGQQAAGVLVFKEPDPWQCPHPVTHDRLEERPGRADELEVGVIQQQAPVGDVEADLRGVHHAGVSRPQILNDPREQLGQAHQACGQQDVDVPSLGDAPAAFPGLGQGVTLDDRHSVETLGQGRRSRQSRQAGTQHNRVLAHMSHLCPAFGPVVTADVSITPRMDERARPASPESTNVVKIPRAQF